MATLTVKSNGKIIENFENCGIKNAMAICQKYADYKWHGGLPLSPNDDYQIILDGELIQSKYFEWSDFYEHESFAHIPDETETGWYIVVSASGNNTLACRTSEQTAKLIANDMNNDPGMRYADTESYNRGKPYCAIKS